MKRICMAALLTGVGAASASAQGIGTDSVRWDPVSLDAASPSVGGSINTASIYQRRQPAEWSTPTSPLLHVSNTALGLGATDTLDAISLNQPTSLVALYFSVDRGSQGLAGTHVNHQAVRSQHAADRFVVELGAGSSLAGATAPGTNVLSSNHQKYGFLPHYVGTYDDAAAINTDFTGSPQDNANSLVIEDIDFGSDNVHDARLYFSLGNGSPSLSTITLSTTASKSDILTVASNSSTITRFAEAASLGLSATDDELDAVAVWDVNGNGAADNGDAAVFSLAPGSTSLGSASPADLFISTLGGSFSPFLTAASLGLRDIDNIDGIDFSGVYSAPDAQFIPEPAALALLTMSLAAVARRRNRA